jgi:hypothetical protein
MKHSQIRKKKNDILPILDVVLKIMIYKLATIKI